MMPACLACSLGFGMLLNEVDAFHDYLLFPGVGEAHLALFALVLAGDNQHGIVFPDLHLKSLLIVRLLQHLGRQGNNLGEFLVPQLPGHRPENTGAFGVILVRQNHRGVLIEPDVRAVGAPVGAGAADDDRPDDIALLDVRASGMAFFTEATMTSPIWAYFRRCRPGR